MQIKRQLKAVSFGLSNVLYSLVLILGLTACQSEVDDTFSTQESSEAYQAILPESVWEKFEEIKDHEKQAQFLLSLISDRYLSQHELALTLAEQAELLSRRANDQQVYARALYWKSFLVNQQDPENVDLQRALTDVKISIDLQEKRRPSIWLVRALNLRAQIHYNLYEEAIGEEYNQEAFKVLTLLELPFDSLCRDWGDLYRTGGNISYYTTESRDTVLAYYDKAYEAYQTCQEQERLARLLSNYAIFYEGQQNYTTADSLLEAAIALYQQTASLEQKRGAQLDYATFHARRFSNTENEFWYEHSMRLLFDLLDNRKDLVAEVYYEIGANHQNHAVTFSESAPLHYDSAVFYYDLVMDHGMQEGNARYIQKAEESIAKICPDIGTQRCSALLSKSTEANREISYLTRLSFREAAGKREQFKSNQAEERQRLILTTVVIIIVALTTIFLLLYQRSRVLFLQQQLENRMEALRSQMNPHFISNSLNAIDSLVNKGEQEQASEYLIDFSRLCRLILNNSKVKHISLTKELETLRYYLSLEKLRMRSTLNYHFAIDESLNLDTIQIAPMVLQPFIENAIIHGIQNKQAPGNIWITISRINENLLEIRVKDDGVGREKAQELRAKSILDRPSWGMAITEERLQSLKNQRSAQIRYTDLFNEQGEACGTEVIIHYSITYSQQ